MIWSLDNLLLQSFWTNTLKNWTRVKPSFSWCCWLTIFFACSRWTLQMERNTDSKSKRSGWSTYFWLVRSSERPEAWSWNFLRNIRIERGMNKVSPKKAQNRVSLRYLYLSRAWKSQSQRPILWNRSLKMNRNGGNNAKIKWVQPQPSPFQGENVGKNHQTWNFGPTYITKVQKLP